MNALSFASHLCVICLSIERDDNINRRKRQRQTRDNLASLRKDVVFSGGLSLWQLQWKTDLLWGKSEMKEGNCEIMLAAGRDTASSYPCGCASIAACTECGSNVCDLHAEQCDVCHGILCGSCYDLHVGKSHGKPVQPVRENRTRRRLA